LPVMVHRPAPEMRADSSRVGWKGYLAGYGAQAGAGDAGRFLQGGVHTFEGAGHLEEDKGKEIHGLDGDDAAQAHYVDGRPLQAEHGHEELVYVAGPGREQHLPGQGADE